MPLLALVLEVRDASALVALLSLAINAALLLPVRRELPWRRVAALLAGSLAGIPAGVLLLAGADPRLARGLLGAALVATGAALLRERRPTPGGGRGAALAAGALAGLLGGAFNMNGPVVTLYAAARGWDKRETHAALQLYFLASGLAIAALHGAAGITSGPVLLAVRRRAAVPGRREPRGVEGAPARRRGALSHAAASVAARGRGYPARRRGVRLSGRISLRSPSKMTVRLN